MCEEVVIRAEEDFLLVLGPGAAAVEGKVVFVVFGGVGAGRVAFALAYPVAFGDGLEDGFGGDVGEAVLAGGGGSRRDSVRRAQVF